jgi:hypothetical protein
MQSHYYSDTYEEARAKFLEATADADTRFHDTVVDGLTVDTAIYRAEEPRDTLLIVSGTHGIEGFSGSAVQLMVLDRFRERLSPTTTLVLIHALNPYGFAHQTRVNHHRVDLNRTFLDTPEAFRTGDADLDAAFDTLYPILTPKRPRQNHRIESWRFYRAIAPVVLRAKRTGTYPQIKNAIAGGQYRYPDSLFYGGGDTPGGEPEVAIFRRILETVSIDKKRLFVMDCHTGLGKRGEAVYFSANPSHSEPFANLRTIEPTFTSIVADEAQSDEIYEAKGTLVQYALKHSRAETTYSFGLDLGTIPNIPMLSRLIAENQVHHFPETPEAIRRQVRRDFREAFYPSNRVWREKALSLYTTFLDALIEKMGL